MICVTYQTFPKKNLKFLNERFINGKTILHIACKFSLLDIVEKLLNIIDIDGNLLDPNIRDDKGATALHGTSDTKVIKMLVDYGAKVNSRDLEGNTPLHLKCNEGNIEAIKLLVYYNADLVAENNEVRKKINNKNSS